MKKGLTQRRINAAKARSFSPYVSRFASWYLCAFALLFFLFPAAIHAQAPSCGYVTDIDFPVDPSVFTIAQDYAAPSPRHQGRYHTGEDWTLRENPPATEGQFVRAIADGRVLFSSPNGWGIDGGVIMIEHTFPDNSVATSLYGHITDSTGVQFPAIYTCVKKGDILAAVGDARPAPHVHIEIRAETSSTIGAGYSWDNPTTLAHRRPSKFILNWQAWLSNAYRWHLDLGDETGAAVEPIQLDDNSVIYVDRDRLARVNPNGGVLWRANLAARPLALQINGFNIAVTLSNGTIAHYGLDGSPLASEPAPPVNAQLPPIMDERTGADITIIQTPDHRLLTLDLAGNVLNRAQLREAASLALDSDGVPLVYSQGGLWRIENQGGDIVWTPALTFAPAGGARSAVYADADGYTLFDGDRLWRYARDESAVWQSELTGLPTVGAANLQQFDSFYLLTTDGGDIAAFRVTDGAFCNRMRVFGDHRSRSWANLGSDGLLRVFVADQIMALNWQRFLSACSM